MIGSGLAASARPMSNVCEAGYLRNQGPRSPSIQPPNTIELGLYTAVGSYMRNRGTEGQREILLLLETDMKRAISLLEAYDCSTNVNGSSNSTMVGEEACPHMQPESRHRSLGCELESRILGANSTIQAACIGESALGRKTASNIRKVLFDAILADVSGYIVGSPYIGSLWSKYIQSRSWPPGS